MRFDPAKHYREQMQAAGRRAAGVPLTHGRTRKRYAQRAVLILFLICGTVAFVAWALGLALLILIVTN